MLTLAFPSRACIPRRNVCQAVTTSTINNSCSLKISAMAEPKTHTVLRGSKQALISVADKKNLYFLGDGLQKLGYSITATEGNASLLKNSGVHVSHVVEVPDNKLPPIYVNAVAIGFYDIVVINIDKFLYENDYKPKKIAEIIDKIDLCGMNIINEVLNKLSMEVMVIVNPEDYQRILEKPNGGRLDEHTMKSLVERAKKHVEEYEGVISPEMKRPFKPMKDLDMNQVIKDIIDKIK